MATKEHSMIRRSIATILGVWVVLTAGLHAAPGPIWDIRYFGAVADATTLNTACIQKAIDACHAQGGGRVLVCGGDYLTGTLRLKSNVTLYVEAGARLLGSPHIEDYVAITPVDYNQRMAGINLFLDRGLICAQDARNIGVEGKGTIDCHGPPALCNPIGWAHAARSPPILVVKNPWTTTADQRSGPAQLPLTTQ
jgi:hypothetical protein